MQKFEGSHSEPESRRCREREKGCEGSLTSLAKQVFLPHIKMQVLNPQFAFLDMELLLIAITVVVDGALSLVR